MSDVVQQLSDQIFLTDSGLETDLIFHRGIALRSFAAFPLLDDPAGLPMLAQYYRDHAAVAAEYDVGFIYETPTWRANADWGAQLGYDAAALRAVNSRAVELMSELRAEANIPSVISGCIGPRCDGYRPQSVMTAPESRAYHRTQLETFGEAGADLASALTITYPDEAIGIVQAADDVGLPVAVSFTVETDGRLPDGSLLENAIGMTDDATDAGAAYFMINCAHPTHIEHALPAGADWTGRVRGILANASRRSHAELDEAADLDDGDPVEFGRDYQRLRALAPRVTILGGCCGTDVRHVRAIAAASITS